jgi:hypothetical protein
MDADAFKAIIEAMPGATCTEEEKGVIIVTGEQQALNQLAIWGHPSSRDAGRDIYRVQYQGGFSGCYRDGRPTPTR